MTHPIYLLVHVIYHSYTRSFIRHILLSPIQISYIIYTVFAIYACMSKCICMHIHIMYIYAYTMWYDFKRCLPEQGISTSSHHQHHHGSVLRSKTKNFKFCRSNIKWWLLYNSLDLSLREKSVFNRNAFIDTFINLYHMTRGIVVGAIQR